MLIIMVAKIKFKSFLFFFQVAAGPDLGTLRKGLQGFHLLGAERDRIFPLHGYLNSKGPFFSFLKIVFTIKMCISLQIVYITFLK